MVCYSNCWSVRTDQWKHSKTGYLWPAVPKPFINISRTTVIRFPPYFKLDVEKCPFSNTLSFHRWVTIVLVLPSQVTGKALTFSYRNVQFTIKILFRPLLGSLQLLQTVWSYLYFILVLWSGTFSISFPQPVSWDFACSSTKYVTAQGFL